MEVLMESKKIIKKSVDYRCGNALLEGYASYTEYKEGNKKVPGVVIIHEWWGLNDYAKHRADMISDLGYAAFAADIYGKGLLTTNPDEAQKLATYYRSNRKLLRERVAAAIDELKKLHGVDPKKIAVMGYCFGGGAALEIARAGADIVGAASFHGNLDCNDPAEAKNIKAKIIAFHGGNDFFVPEKDVIAFENEMRNAGVDWQLNIYGGAVHAFTNPASGNDPSKGMAYNEKADKRSWKGLLSFFDEIFG